MMFVINSMTDHKKTIIIPENTYLRILKHKTKLEKEKVGIVVNFTDAILDLIGRGLEK